MNKAETELNKLIDDVMEVFPFVEVTLDPITINYHFERLKIRFMYKGERYGLEQGYIMANFEDEYYRIHMREDVCLKIMNLIWTGGRING